jgi:putative FmdB family regulatory protein
MPIYEYVCGNCHEKFSQLRPMSKADSPAPCGGCGSSNTTRAISLFSAISRRGNGESHHVKGTGGGCGSCGGGHCGTCSQ